MLVVDRNHMPHFLGLMFGFMQLDQDSRFLGFSGFEIAWMSSQPTPDLDVG